MKYVVYVPVVSEQAFEVNANSADAAIDAAITKAGAWSSLCHQCARKIGEPQYDWDQATAQVSG
ncbi:MAG TPA: hypothetical protein VHY35_17890 [Stellaceae bacterium]|jgi:hypothetical protein|nr:hypothetical protein [Stellaceae bacterium]